MYSKITISLCPSSPGVTFVGVILVIEMMSDESRELLLQPAFNALEHGLVK